MDLTQLANFGEFVGGIAVLVTLIYLSTQIRDARRQLAEQSVSTAIGAMMTSFDPVYRAECSPTFRRGLDGEELNDPDEAYVFDMLMHRQAGSAVVLARTETEVGHQMIEGLKGLVWSHPGAERWVRDMPESAMKHSLVEALRERRVGGL